MKIKLNELESNIRAINCLGAKKLPIKLSYILSKNAKKLIEEYELMSEQRVKILEKDCVRDKENKPALDKDNAYTYPDEATKNNMLKELQELFDTETDVDIVKISCETLEMCNGEKFDILTLNEISALDFMIE
jgi:hypothetical protein